MKGQIATPTVLLVSIFLILLLVFGLWAIWNSLRMVRVGLVTGAEAMQGFTILNHVITSQTCLGTGKVGVLNESLLDEKNGTIPCTELPNFNYRVQVNDTKNDLVWEFGPNLAGKPKEFYVAIQKDGEVVPGYIYFWHVYQEDDILLLAATLAEQAWYRGEAIRGFVPDGHFTLEFKEDEICYKGLTKRCKKLPYARISTVLEETFAPAQICSISFKKKAKLEVEVDCIIVGD
jgi:hypothetical protein